MPSRISITDPSEVAQSWLTTLSNALRSRDTSKAVSLFGRESSWRDLFSLSWDIHSMVGRDAIQKYLEGDGRVGGSKLAFMRLKGVAKFDTWLGQTSIIFAFFNFETKIARGQGILRLAQDPDSDKWLGFTLYTGLEELKGHEEITIAPIKVENTGVISYQQGPETYDDYDPEVLIVGAGQSGLTAAARLDRLNVKTLIIDKEPRAGDSWRNRYDALLLHDPVWVDHLPYLPFPEDWPVLMPRIMIADWFDSYAKALQMNLWTCTTMDYPVFDETTQEWTVTLTRADGSKRIMHPKHLIIATGIVGEAVTPAFKGIDTFKGPIIHSSKFKSGRTFSGKKTIVVGACNSAMDISLDLEQNGSDVTIVQRSSTYVMSMKGAVDIVYGKDKYMTNDLSDMLKFSAPLSVATQAGVAYTAAMKEYDAEMLAGLEKAGYKVDFGYENAGFYLKVLFRGGGYYFDIGCCEAIINGRIKVKQGQEIDHFEEDGIVFADGVKIQADAVVCATGYSGFAPSVRRILGDKVMERVGKVCTVDEDGERKGVWRPSGHPNLWFHVGNIAMSRFYSKHLALQVKAQLHGLHKL
ncbi:hypothetical protein BOTBODRAFT_30735 [Botryobasidium botryosum FD-172 SS1]|uniref:Uncharacterized protein n=1 Tax=Botryobasidium botryosum (strain FD-172 SS1) TaxID=930990 RepID=A0A067MMU5_BOTB1|nr:hypothetical protein BOTBODRAFT_30735 [Botryobasidium botryosum FD-172 SS1]